MAKKQNPVLARTLKQILGPDGWKKHQTKFPLLEDYWEEGENHGQG